MQTVTVATMNAYNLFGPNDIKPGTRDRVKSERSQAALAEQIDRIDADVVALQELTSEESLRELILSRRDLAEKYKHVALVPSYDHRGINVGIISKYPFNAVVSHKDTEFPLADGSGTGTFSRDFLRVDINTDDDPDTELTVYNTHSKSRRPSDSGPSSDTVRLSQAMAMRQIAEEEMKEYPGRLFVLTGDFNDGFKDASVQAILNPKNGGEKWLDSLDHLPDEERNTWPSNPNSKGKFAPVQFDHIIYPERFDDQLVESKKVRIEASDSSDTKWVSTAASDHLPVNATFEIRD
jgi:endonuclease/exonuclease/phosphatase family metal-dependent hydrolase